MSLLWLLAQLLTFYSWIIILQALLSWFRPNPRNPAVVLLMKLTEPVLAPLRRLAPPRALGGLDISPILALALLYLARRALFSFAAAAAG